MCGAATRRGRRVLPIASITTGSQAATATPWKVTRKPPAALARARTVAEVPPAWTRTRTFSCAAKPCPDTASGRSPSNRSDGDECENARAAIAASTVPSMDSCYAVLSQATPPNQRPRRRAANTGSGRARTQSRSADCDRPPLASLRPRTARCSTRVAAPLTPAVPAVPSSPSSPSRAPGVPGSPFTPAGPAGPAAPAGPCGPGTAAGISPALRSEARSDPALTLADVTAFAPKSAVLTSPSLIELDTTAFLALVAAATDVPPNATNSDT